MASVSFVIGILGNVTAIFLLFTPMPAFWEIVKVKSTGSYSAQPYLFSLLSGLLWAYYALLDAQDGSKVLVVTISAASATFQLLYLALYLYFATTKSQRMKTCFLLFLILAFFMALVLSTIKLNHEDMIPKVGFLCIFGAIFSNAAPLTIIWKVIKTASVHYMPFTLSLGLLVNGAMWLAYAISSKDIYLLITNSIGVFLAMAQVSIYTIYKVFNIKPLQVTNEKLQETTIKDLEMHFPNDLKMEDSFSSPLEINIVHLPHEPRFSSINSLSSTNISVQQIV